MNNTRCNWCGRDTPEHTVPGYCGICGLWTARLYGTAEATARDRGIEQATGSQSAVWVAQALAAVKSVAERQEHLSADDVCDAFNDNTGAEPTNRSAIAGILKTASGKKLRYVTPTDRSVASRGVGRHKSRITVWRSLLCQAC